MPVFSTYRVAPLMDRAMFELPPGAQPTTRQGDPWLRWAKVGEDAGWYSVGARAPDFGERPSFWDAVLTLATEVGNGKLDAVHCVGPGILSVGGLGLTASSGYAQALLADCLVAEPLWFMAHMGAVTAESGAWIRVMIDGHHEGSRRPLKYDEQRSVFLQTQYGPCSEHEQIEGAIRRGGGLIWSRSRKRVAKKWVQHTSRMLRHPAMDKVQARFCEARIPKLICPVRSLIQWPGAGIRDGWMYTPEQQALWCVVMTAAIEDDEQTQNLVRESVETRPVDARLSLANCYENVLRSAYTQTFVRRVRNSVERVQELFRIEVLS